MKEIFTSCGFPARGAREARPEGGGPPTLSAFPDGRQGERGGRTGRLPRCGRAQLPLRGPRRQGSQDTWLPAGLSPPGPPVPPTPLPISPVRPPQGSPPPSICPFPCPASAQSEPPCLRGAAHRTLPGPRTEPIAFTPDFSFSCVPAQCMAQCGQCPSASPRPRAVTIP